MKNQSWHQIRLGDAVKINNKSIDRSFHYDEIEYFDTSSVYKNFFNEPEVLKREDAPSRARRLVQNGDVIISTVRPNQEHVGLIQKPKENTVVSTGFAVITPISIESKFLYYYLSQPSIVAYLSAIAETSTSTFPAIRPEILEDLQVTIPAYIEEQKRIGEFLFLFDQKIDLNLKTNQTLEEISQAIFKEWFIDFNYPGATGEMVDSPLGPIPKGWRMGNIGEVADVIDCLHSKKPDRLEKKTNRLLLQLWNILDSGHIDTSDPYWISESDYTRWTSRIEASEGIIVITNVGRTGVAARIPKNLQAALGRNMTAIRVKDFFPFNIFMILLLTSDFMKNEIALRTDVGTILDSLNVRNIPLLRFVIPPNDVIFRFEQIVTPIWELIDQNMMENSGLSQIRDFLLSKLMTGDIEI